MRWKGRRKSENVEDHRGMSRGKVAAGGGIGVLLIAVIAMLFGADPSALIRQLGAGGGGGAVVQGGEQSGPRPDDPLAEFVKVVLADTEDVWSRLLPGTYREPKLRLFEGSVQSACGQATAQVGPFYCSADERVYIDLSFYRDLKERFDAPGDFAQAYVIAHEVGHHIQHLLGKSGEVHRMRGRISQEQYNELSVRLELQADFYAGVWAHHAQRMKNILERGDLEEAMRCAAAIGDDRLQKQAQGYVQPDTFTHGTSEQRVRWFRKGFETGDLRQGDTFAVRNP